MVSNDLHTTNQLESLASIADANAGAILSRLDAKLNLVRGRREGL